MAEPDQLKKETVRIELPIRESGNPPMPASFPSGRKEEPARIPLMPEPLRPSQKRTQPPLATAQVDPHNPPIAVAPAEKSSMLLYWLLLGISALILIIQIWIYFS